MSTSGGNIMILLLMFLFLFTSTKCSYIVHNDISIDTPNVLLNERPIIGILTEELNSFLKQYNSERVTNSRQYSSYIAASYVKFIEGAGARVVPIWIGQETEYYENILGKINGVLWPGGSSLFNISRGYAEAGFKIYRIAKKMNEAGDYFPIFGICLGLELITYVEANKEEHRVDCSSQRQALPLYFNKAYQSSRLFGNASLDIINILKTENVTINYHKYCLTKKALKKVYLSERFRITSHNSDIHGLKFISSLEHVRFPFYGLQFHPEKNIYEWIEDKNIPHTANAIRVGQYFANFFVNEARKSAHRYLNFTEELASLIYNYPVFYTGIRGSSYEQCYQFS